MDRTRTAAVPPECEAGPDASAKVAHEQKRVQKRALRPRQALKRLAMFQSSMLALIIGLSILILLYIVFYNLHSLSALPRTETAWPGGKRSFGDATARHPSQFGASQAGQAVHVRFGPGHGVRWRFQLDDEDQRIKSLFTGQDGAAYIVSGTQSLQTSRLDVVSASGELNASYCTPQFATLLALGADDALLLHERSVGGKQRDQLSACNLEGRHLWQAQLPYPFNGDLAVGGKGVIYAVGVNAQPAQSGCAQSCLCKLSPSGKIRWSYKQAGGLYRPLPLADGGVLVWSSPRYEYRENHPEGIEFNWGTKYAKQPFKLLHLDSSGRLRWSFEAGMIQANNVTVAGGKVCTQLVDANAANNQLLVLLSLNTGREVARYLSGPLGGPLLLRRDGAVVFQNRDDVLVALSPEMKLLWTKPLYRPLRHAPLVESDNAIYFPDEAALACLEADGSERFRIPNGLSFIGLDAQWGPDGMIYVPTCREVMAFQPQ